MVELDSAESDMTNGIDGTGSSDGTLAEGGIELNGVDGFDPLAMAGTFRPRPAIDSELSVPVGEAGLDLVARARTDPGGFLELLTRAFGPKVAGARGASLVEAIANGEVPMPAEIRLVGDDVLPPGAMGAYDADAAGSAGAILLHRDLLEDPDRLDAVLTEELGHHLDHVLGGADTIGDEGEVFALLLDGEDVDAARAEDDRGALLKGQEVEFNEENPPLDPVAIDGTTPNAADLDTSIDSTGSEEDAAANANTAVQVSGNVIGGDGRFYDPGTDMWRQIAEQDLTIKPDQLVGPVPPQMFEGRVVMVNGVTVSPSTAFTNARLLSQQTGNEVVAVYNGPLHPNYQGGVVPYLGNFPGTGGRISEFGDA